ncbi:MAG: M23 family metallopeptidase, partial [Patescibacteria group bacterium]
APIGTPLYASAAGTVIIARTGGWNGGYGNYVVIKHDNGTQTLYGHMNTVTVAPGQTIGQGDPVGTVGNSGNSTGPHIHFEIRGARNPF